MTNKYYELTGKIDGEIEVLFGSFDRSDVVYEKEAEKATLKEQGYKGLKIVSRLVEESPDPEVYGDEEYKRVTCEALKEEEVTICVGDSGEDYDDLEHSRDLGEIIEAVEATDSPIVNFYKAGVPVGWILVAVGEDPDETIVDYSANDFMNKLIEICSSIYSL